MIITVVGNYPKIPNNPHPQKLRRALTQFEKGEITAQQRAEVEDEVTREVINEQVEAGVELITDGQIRWEDGQTYLAKKLAGFSINGLSRYFDTNMYFRQPIVEGRVEWREPITIRDFQFAAQNSPRPVKAVLTGPYTLARLSKNQHYPEFSALVLDLAKALNQEARALQAAGAKHLQFDEPSLLKHKTDFSVFREAAEILADEVSAKKALVTYFGDVSGIYPQILGLPFQVIGLDFVVAPQNFEIISTAPFTKELAAGIVDARNTRLETVEEILAAIDRLRGIIPLDRLYLSPNCGLEFLPREVAQAKLARLADAVNEARKLWEAN